MASLLAYLKSKLLLPQDDNDDSENIKGSFIDLKNVYISGSISDLEGLELLFEYVMELSSNLISKLLLDIVKIDIIEIKFQDNSILIYYNN